MLSRSRVSAVVCSSDLERSRDFYEKRLGFVLSPKAIKNHLVYEFGNGESLVIYGRPSPNKADHTQMRFWSTAIEKDVMELAAAGVVFDELDMGAIKTVNHIATVPGIGRSAWFKDPDGNTLAVFQPE
jgi:predicted enzyme related to lactoylglutathione lyase